jgi:hypothetical protein
MLDNKIDSLYEPKTRQILQQVGRYRLPEFVEYLDDPRLILSSFYGDDQPNWNIIQKSQLIESFFLNIPVLPITLWEISLNSYEILDGKRRVNALQGFYNNKWQLEGLEIFPELNGCTYRQLPYWVKDVLDRRRLSTIVLIADSISLEDALKIKRLTFDRLHLN